LALLPAFAAVLVPAWPLKLWVLSFSVSVLFLVSVLLEVAYGAWTTTLILDTVRQGRADPARALCGLKRCFLRVLGLEAIGWGALFAGLALAIAMAPAAMPLTILFIGLGSLLWNLATAALLPVALDEPLSIRFGHP
jgi:hypothetical protein